MTGGYVIAYSVTLASFIVIWFNHPILLYIGRDANLSLWLSKAYADWAYPLDVTAMNPFQGMTSMLMPINPYFNPGTWIFQAALPEVPSRVASFIVYFLEVTASAFLLGVALGFSRLFAFVGALWLAFLLGDQHPADVLQPRPGHPQPLGEGGQRLGGVPARVDQHHPAGDGERIGQHIRERAPGDGHGNAPEAVEDLLDRGRWCRLHGRSSFL